MSDYQWPEDPRVGHLLSVFTGLVDEFRDRVQATKTTAEPERWDTLLQVVWRLTEVEEAAYRNCHKLAPVRPAKPVGAQEPVGESQPNLPLTAGPQTPLDPDYDWQQHEDRP